VATIRRLYRVECVCVGGGGVCGVVSGIRVGASGWEGGYSVLH